jgi:hypothetical protein
MKTIGDLIEKLELFKQQFIGKYYKRKSDFYDDYKKQMLVFLNSENLQGVYEPYTLLLATKKSVRFLEAIVNGVSNRKRIFDNRGFKIKTIEYATMQPYQFSTPFENIDEIMELQEINESIGKLSNSIKSTEEGLEKSKEYLIQMLEKKHQLESKLIKEK